MQPLARRLLALLLAALLAAPALAQEHAFTAAPEGLTGPAELPSGVVSVTFTNADEAPHMLLLARLNDGVSQEDLQAALAEAPEAAFGLVTPAGGFGPTMPGQTALITFELPEPGDYIGLDMMSGQMLAFTVTESAAQGERPAADLTVQMLDFGYDLPAELPAGEQVWEVVNAGQEPHELILFKVEPGTTPEDLMAAMEADPEGEFAEMAGGVMPMAPGYANFVTLDLAAGDYIAWCFIPSPEHGGAPHFALGMAKPFTVVGD
jgi:hypothetical protein